MTSRLTTKRLQQSLQSRVALLLRAEKSASKAPAKKTSAQRSKPARVPSANTLKTTDAAAKGRLRSMMTARISVANPVARKLLGPEPWKPHRYQQKAIKFLLEHAAAGLFLDPGLGKTAIALAAFKILRRLQAAERMLVVAPLRPATLVWPAEIAKWADFCDLKVVVLHGDKKESLLAEAAEADIVVINPEGLEWLFDVQKVRRQTRTGKTKVDITVNLDTRFRKLRCDTLVVDEASKFKHSDNQRFRILKTVLDFFDRRWALTGSPSAGGLMDLFGIMYVIDGGHALGPFITHYRNAYFYPSGWGGYDYQLQPGAEKRIYERIAPSVLRMDADDYLELPQVVSSVTQIILPDNVRRMYDELETEFITEIEDIGKVIMAPNSGASLVKCRQIANGGIYLEREVNELGKKMGPREWRNLHDEKVQAALDYRDEILGNQLLVTFDFEHDLDRLLAGFGKDTPYIKGGMTVKKIAELEARWNMGEIPVLLANAETVALGLNLQGSDAHHIFLHSLTYSYEVYDQLIRRLRRQGNKAKRVFVRHAVAKNTVDEAMMEAVKKKRKGQDDLFSYLKAYARKRKADMGEERFNELVREFSKKKPSTMAKAAKRRAAVLA
jgi:SNF2 family DNA or RNA helicase